jgi:DNA-binding winged helix-turn-helix (wHTH) protein/Tol biopolymer transport system component
MGNSIQRTIVRFEDFEVNLETGEVWKAGRPIKVQDQPFRILAALLERPGQIVTREELRQLIWPDQTFGDFDHAINLALTKLRAALGDAADVPHLIETLPRRGYRFIAPLKEHSDPPAGRAIPPLGNLQFGAYELDRDAMELRKDGVPVRLQEQPLRVLATLVERPGEIVTREELQQQIWGKDTFVDFEQSLNKAVNRLREALDDNAAEPKYVETLPRRGYRFIAPVTELNATGPPPQVPPAPNSASDAEPVSLKHRRARIVTIIPFATALLFMGIGITAALLWKRPEKSMLGDAKRITAASGCCATLSRDGKLLAYASGIAGGVLHIWVQQTEGGEPIQVTRGPERDDWPDFSPDGTHIAFCSWKDGGGIFIVPALSGEPKRLTTSGCHPQYFPDGRQILYLDGTDRYTDAMIVSADSDTRTPLRLNQNFLVHGPALLSPDGDQIIFNGVSKRESDRQDRLWIASVAASEASLLRLPGTEQDDAGELGAWVRGKDGRQWIIYSLSRGELWKVLRVGISPRGQIRGEPEQLSSGTGHLGSGFSVSQDGKLIYTLLSITNSIYEIPTDIRGEKTGPTLQLPLPEGSSRSPSVSRDGKWMAYNSFISGKSNLIRLRDLASGADRVLDEIGRRLDGGGETSISPDGSEVIFERDCKTSIWERANHVPCGFMVPAAGGEPEQICEFCTARGFSSSGSTVLVQKYYARPASSDWIAAVDLTTRTEREFLKLPENGIYHPFFSWDDRWVAFKKDVGDGQLAIAPVRNGVAGKEAEWISITDGRYYNDKPQFSPDGNTLYFTSSRDGYLCIWAQKLDPMTKRPVGEPFAFEHFHNSAGRDAAAFWGSSFGFPDLSVARDKILIELPQLRSDVWMTQVQ